MKKLFYLLFMLFFAVTVSIAADSTNITVTLVQGTGGAVPSSSRPFDFAIYFVDLIHTGAATDNVTSQVINTSGLKLVSIQMLAFGATRDVNLTLQGSAVLNDSSFVASPFSRTGVFTGEGDFDDYSPDAGNTDQLVLPEFYVAVDSLGGESNASVVAYLKRSDPALTAKYIRIRSDGQAGNLATTSTKVYFIFKIIDKSRTFFGAVDAS